MILLYVQANVLEEQHFFKLQNGTEQERVMNSVDYHELIFFNA